jgi:hypothetical protein
MSTLDPVAIAAAITSLCALFATLWQAQITREHNRLSVRPTLVWHQMRSITDAGIEVVFSVRNCGIGPALVKDRYFMLNGRRFTSVAPHGDQIRELGEAVLAQKLSYFIREHGLPGIGVTIPQNAEYVIARISFPNASPSLLDSIRIDEVAFCLTYESSYKETYHLKGSF